jgi:hypothetical protein
MWGSATMLVEHPIGLLDRVADGGHIQLGGYNDRT